MKMQFLYNLEPEYRPKLRELEAAYGVALWRDQGGLEFEVLREVMVAEERRLREEASQRETEEMVRAEMDKLGEVAKGPVKGSRERLQGIRKERARVSEERRKRADAAEERLWAVKHEETSEEDEDKDDDDGDDDDDEVVELKVPQRVERSEDREVERRDEGSDESEVEYQEESSEESDESVESEESEKEDEEVDEQEEEEAEKEEEKKKGEEEEEEAEEEEEEEEESKEESKEESEEEEQEESEGESKEESEEESEEEVQEEAEEQEPELEVPDLEQPRTLIIEVKDSEEESSDEEDEENKETERLSTPVERVPDTPQRVAKQSAAMENPIEQSQPAVSSDPHPRPNATPLELARIGQTISASPHSPSKLSPSVSKTPIPIPSAHTTLESSSSTYTPLSPACPPSPDSNEPYSDREASIRAIEKARHRKEHGRAKRRANEAAKYSQTAISLTTTSNAALESARKRTAVEANVAFDKSYRSSSSSVNRTCYRCRRTGHTTEDACPWSPSMARDVESGVLRSVPFVRAAAARVKSRVVGERRGGEGKGKETRVVDGEKQEKKGTESRVGNRERKGTERRVVDAEKQEKKGKKRKIEDEGKENKVPEVKSMKRKKCWNKKTRMRMKMRQDRGMN